MITRSKFDEYKRFREQAGCPFCSRKEVLDGDGLFYCNLDKKFNPLEEKIIKKFNSKWWFLHIFDKDTTSYFAWHCERCHRYWIENSTGKMIKEIPWEIEKIPKEDSEWFTASAHKAVMRLAEKANEFFEQEYKSSDEIHNIINTYIGFLAKRHMDIINGRHIIDETIKPLCLHSEKLKEWVRTTILISVKKKFPYKSDCVHEALKVYEEYDKLIDVVYREFAHKLMLGFLMDLWQSMKKHYERVLQNVYPSECNLLNSISQEEWRNGIWEELYGRSIIVIYDGFINLGFDIRPLISDKDKIILGNLKVFSDGIADIYITDNAAFGNIETKVTTKKEEDNKMKIEIEENETRLLKTTVSEGSVGNVETLRIAKNKADETITEIGKVEDINNLIKEINNSQLDKEIALKLINLLQEVTQAIETNDTAKQTETKQKISGFWLGVGSTVQKVLQSSANLTRVLEYLGIKLLLN